MRLQAYHLLTGIIEYCVCNSHILRDSKSSRRRQRDDMTAKQASASFDTCLGPLPSFLDGEADLQHAWKVANWAYDIEAEVMGRCYSSYQLTVSNRHSRITHRGTQFHPSSNRRTKADRGHLDGRLTNTSRSRGKKV